MFPGKVIVAAKQVASSSMVTVYQLCQNKQHIEAMRQATLKTWKFGVARTHGLFGSDEWWKNIESGKLVTHTLRGVITRLYMGSMNDWPMFSMRSDTGKDLDWSRYANSKELADSYAVGREIEIDYVLQRHRLFSDLSFLKRHEVVIEIRIGEVVQSLPPAESQFYYQAAKGSWASSIIVFFLLVFSSTGAKVILELIALLLILAGLSLGIIALFGIRKHGTKNILAPALVGIIINGLLLFIFINNFLAARHSG